MAHTMDCKLADGTAVTVEYETEGDGSGPSYSPMYGADGGDPLIVIVLKIYRKADEQDVAVSDDESERLAAFITEHHEFDDGDPWMDEP